MIDNFDLLLTLISFPNNPVDRREHLSPTSDYTEHSGLIKIHLLFKMNIEYIIDRCCVKLYDKTNYYMQAYVHAVIHSAHDLISNTLLSSIYYINVFACVYAFPQ